MEIQSKNYGIKDNISPKGEVRDSRRNRGVITNLLNCLLSTPKMMKFYF